MHAPSATEPTDPVSMTSKMPPPQRREFMGRFTARRNEDTRRGAASDNCRNGGIAAGPRRDLPPRQGLDRSVPGSHSAAPPRALAIQGECTVSTGVARIKSNQARSDCSRFEGAKARSIGIL